MSEEIKQSIVVNASREKVFNALVKADKLVRWFLSRAESDPRPGGKFRYEWHFQDSSQNGVQEGAYQEVIPPETVSYPWEAGNQSTQVEFRLSDVDGGTRVDLLHGGWGSGQESEEVRQMHAQVWSGYMNNLKLYLEKGEDQRAAMMDQITI
jgi:uncharacterized protein YndB with AHSA1/START domain